MIPLLKNGLCLESGFHTVYSDGKEREEFFIRYGNDVNFLHWFSGNDPFLVMLNFLNAIAGVED